MRKYVFGLLGLFTAMNGAAQVDAQVLNTLKAKIATVTSISKKLTLQEARNECSALAKANPEILVECSWGTETFTRRFNVLKVFFDGRMTATAKGFAFDGFSIEAAKTQCDQFINNNPSTAVRCVLNGEVIKESSVASPVLPPEPVTESPAPSPSPIAVAPVPSASPSAAPSAQPSTIPSAAPTSTATVTVSSGQSCMPFLTQVVEVDSCQEALSNLQCRTELVQSALTLFLRSNAANVNSQVMIYIYNLITNNTYANKYLSENCKDKTPCEKQASRSSTSMNECALVNASSSSVISSSNSLTRSLRSNFRKLQKGSTVSRKSAARQLLKNLKSHDAKVSRATRRGALQVR
jgi:hypothetical protein